MPDPGPGRRPRGQFFQPTSLEALEPGRRCWAPWPPLFALEGAVCLLVGHPRRPILEDDGDGTTFRPATLVERRRGVAIIANPDGRPATVPARSLILEAK